MLAFGALLALISLLWGYFSIRREVRNTLEIRFFTASGKVISKLMTGAVFFMVVIYASFANNNSNFFVSQSGFNTLFTWGVNFVGQFYPTPLSSTSSFGDFATTVARMQLQGNADFQSLNSTQQTQVLNQSANQIMASFTHSSSSADIASSTASQPASNALYSYFVSLVGQMQEKFGNTFIGVWGLALFLILRSIGIIAVWAAQFVTLIFYEIMLATGFAKIRDEAATKEVIGC